MASSSWADLLKAGPASLQPVVPLDVSKIWTPHTGPQTQFLQSTAYETLYGGAAGGGKTDALLYGALDQAHLPGYRVLFLRRTYPELREVMDRALGVFRRLGATWNEQQKRWTFPSGATYEFGYCESYADVMRYQGQEYTVICYDELGQCAEERIWTYLMSRNRAVDPRLTKRMRASANPGGPGHVWLKRRFVDACPVSGVPWPVDGALTRSFIPARLADNPTLDQNDPTYRSRLAQLPEITRRQLLDGDWSAGAGLALSELNRSVHLVQPFQVPDGYYQWGSFDWGFNHPFVSGWFASDPDGNVYLIDSIQGRRLLPHEIAERILEAFPISLFRKFHAGHDCWNEQKARGENTPSIADQFLKEGIRLQRANISRVTGLNNFRAYLTYDKLDLEHRPPRFHIMDTAANRRVFDCLEGMVTDPDRPEDALKVDADDYGVGGDDPYDMVRYGLAARPLLGRLVDDGPEFTASSPEALKAELYRTRTVKGRAEEGKKLRRHSNSDDWGL